MNEPPDPGGTLAIVKPPSPAAFESISMSVDDLPYETVIRKRSKAKKARKINVDRSRSESESSNDTLILKSDVVLQPGQLSPPHSISSVRDSNTHISQQIAPSVPLPDSPRISTLQSQNSYIPTGRQSYGPNDRGPFTVHVQRNESSPTAGTSLHPVTFGRFLFSRSREFEGVIDGSIKSVGRNRISLDFHSAACANKFMESSSLSHNQFKAFIPSFNITRLGIVRGIPIDMSPEEIMTEMKVPNDCGPIIKARRLNFKVTIEGSTNWKPSQTVVLTFDGQVFPSRVFLGYNSIPVELYSLPTIQCFQCCRYGHTKNQCRSKPTCYKCGLNHLADSCEIGVDSAKCIWCNGNHFATNKSCPEYQRQKNIKCVMSEKAISYAEASKLLPVSKTSYADIASPSLTTSPQQNRSFKNFTVEPSKVHYKKKVSKSVHASPPSRVGYDRDAHLTIIRDDHDAPSQNGCALPNLLCKNSEMPSVQDIIAELLKLLNLLSSVMCNSSSSSPNALPSNAAFNLNSLLSLFQNGSHQQDPSVELS